MGKFFRKSRLTALWCAVLIMTGSVTAAAAESKSDSKSETGQLIDYSEIAENGYYSFSAADASVNENPAFTCFALPVEPGEQYSIKATVWGWACLYKVVDSYDNVILTFDWDGKYDTKAEPEAFDERVVIPEYGARLLVSFKNTAPAVIQKIPLTGQSTTQSSQDISSDPARSTGSAPASRYSYALSKTLCIGDSLTSGAYFRTPLPRNFKSGDSVNQNYPYYLKRMNNMDVVTNAGVSGITVNGWLVSEFKKHNMADYDSFVIWLGTNGGVQGSLDSDVNAFSSYSQYANTGVGNYCTIIEKIKEVNPDCFIALCTVYDVISGGDTDSSNDNIKAIAGKYNLSVIDLSDLSYSSKPELHGRYNNVHFTKAGNIYIANRIINEMERVFDADPSLTEFGITKREN